MPAPVLPKSHFPFQPHDHSTYEVEKPKRFWNPPRPQKCLLKPEDVIKHLTVEEYNDYEVLTRQLEDVREKFEAGSELEIERKH